MRFLINRIQRHICRKGHIVTVARVGNAARGTPLAEVVVKIAHNQIGKRGRSRRTLGKRFFPTAEGGQKHADGFREIARVECGTVNLPKADAAEKIRDIQL